MTCFVFCVNSQIFNVFSTLDICSLRIKNIPGYGFEVIIVLNAQPFYLPEIHLFPTLANEYHLRRCCSFYIILLQIPGIVAGSRSVGHRDRSMFWRYRLRPRQHRPDAPQRSAGDNAGVEAQETWPLSVNGSTLHRVWPDCSGFLPVWPSACNFEPSVLENVAVVCLHQQVLRCPWPYP